MIPGKWKLAGASSFSEGLAAAKVDTFHWVYFNVEGAVIIERVKLKVTRKLRGNMISDVKIRRAGDFRDGLAPIEPAKISYDEPLIYIRPDGTEAFAPSSELGMVVCFASKPREFRDGLVQLLMADKMNLVNVITLPFLAALLFSMGLTPDASDFH